MVDLHHGTGGKQRLVVGEFLHGQNRSAGDVVLVENVHGFELGLGHGPPLDARENLVEALEARGWLGVVGVRLPAGLADDVADCLPDRGLGDEIDVGVGIGLPPLALEDAAWLPAAGVVTRARDRITKRDALAVLAVLRERSMLEALLVAHLHAGKVQNTFLHGAADALALAGGVAWIECRDNAERHMQAGTGIADLRASDKGWAVAEAGGGGRAPRALGNVLVDLAVLVGAGAEPLDGGIDHARIELLDALPREPHTIERAGRKVLDQYVAPLHQALEDLHALAVLAVDGDGTLVVVQHREIETVHLRAILQLPARDITDTGALHLDHVGAEPGQQLRARRTRLDVREVEDLYAFQRLAHVGSLLHLQLGAPLPHACHDPMVIAASIRRRKVANWHRMRHRSPLWFLLQHALRVEIADATALAP